MIINTFRNFLKLESASGYTLFFAAVAALLIANSPWRFYYQTLFNSPLIEHTINDGFMTAFFLLVSMEIKRELLAGELRTFKKALLPIAAASGGMLVPAFVYLIVATHHPAILNGWGIPTATDIAFSLAVLNLLGKRIPLSLKIFLTALAIIDDLGAIIIIALFYTNHIHLLFLGAASSCLLLLTGLNYWNIKRYWPYGMTGLLLWLFILKAGIHPTIAGVLLGFTLPLSLAKKLEETLHSWVAYGILPLFAFANSGFSFTGLSINTLLNPLILGIFLGLVIGKPLGVFGASWLVIKTGWAQLPSQINWRQLCGVAILCGMGFTMSLFIADLAFPSNTFDETAIRLGVVTSSILAAIMGYLVLRIKTFVHRID